MKLSEPHALNLRCRPDLLLEWVPILCPELVKRSLERPLVSGFYRLVTLVFRETARARYFNDRPLQPAAAADEVNDGATLLLLVLLLLLLFFCCCCCCCC